MSLRVLVIAPHPDDEVIGCGGALSLHAAQGDRVVPVFLTSGELGLKHLARATAWAIREKEAQAAAHILGLAEPIFLRLPDWTVGDHLPKGAAQLAPLLKQECPELIYLPHAAEWHPDHQAAGPLLRRAMARVRPPQPVTLRHYEVWTPLAQHDHVWDISAVMPQKLRALRAHRSQLDGFDYVAAVKGLNQFRGALAGHCRYAEVFAEGTPSPAHRRTTGV